MYKLGQVKYAICSNCGKRIRVVFSYGWWVAKCKCGVTKYEPEGDPTRTGGQIESSNNGWWVRRVN